MLRDKVAGFIAEKGLMTPKQRVLVAASGGPDSVALCKILDTLGYVVELAHVNYGLRGADSEADQELVEKLAKDWKMTLHVHRETPSQKGASVQKEARQIRYDFFDRVLKDRDIKVCATAHHADDQVETLLMNFIRGNSPQLMKGIPAKRGSYIRPMLTATKAEIYAYLEENQIPFRQDQSNFKTDYLRNQFRLELLPVLEKINPNFRQQLFNRHQIDQLQTGFIDTILEPYLQEGVSAQKDGRQLVWKTFVADHGQAFLPLMVSRVLVDWGLHGQDLWAALGLIESNPGKQVVTRDGKIVRERDGLAFFPLVPQENQEVEIRPEELPHSTRVGHREVSLKWVSKPVDMEHPGTHFLDAGSLRWPLRLRPWQEGDRMIPLGMQGSKKLSDIFIDEKFDFAQKQRAVIVEDDQDIVLLSDFRIAERVKITPKTRQILMIRFEA